MLIKKAGIVENTKFKRIQYLGYGVCYKVCPSLYGKQDYLTVTHCPNKYLCNYLYETYSIFGTLKNYRFIYDS